MTGARRATLFGVSLVGLILLSGCAKADCVSGPLCGDAPVDAGAGAINGTVQLEGSGLADALVSLSDGSSRRTSTTGAYAFPNVPIGSYTLSISEVTTDASCEVTSMSVSVSATGQEVTRDFDCVYLRTASISGAVRAAGSGLAGITVDLTGPSNSTTQTDDMGEFDFRFLRLGEYTVSVGNPPSNLDLPSATQTLTLATGELATVEFEGELATSAILGAVFVEGEALQGAALDLDNLGRPEEVRSAIVGADGSYSFESVGEGNYVVTVNSLDATFETASRSVDITSSQDEAITADFSGTFLRTASIMGVVGTGGAGIPGVTVTLSEPSGPPSSPSSSALPSGSVTSDARGQFSFEDLRFGEYTVTVSDLPSTGTFPVTSSAFTLVTGESRSMGILGVAPSARDVVGAGNEHSCALDNGTLQCWGRGLLGQLGTGDFETSANLPLASAAGLGIASISLGANHTCGVTGTGEAYCWGSGEDGRLGSSSGTSSDPVLVSGGLTFASVSAGQNHSCGVTRDGAAYCWGDNSDGQLDGNNGGSADSPLPVPGGSTFASVSAGVNSTCGLTTGAEIVCWGDLGDFGEVSLGSGGRSYISVSVGAGFACGITMAGDVYCAGENDAGQLGDGSMVGNGPVPVGGGQVFASVRAGGRRTSLFVGEGLPNEITWLGSACGVTTDGSTLCWGANDSGQLGNGTRFDSNAPMPVSGGLTFSSVSVGYSHSCAVTAQGDSYCWGREGFGALGGGGGTTFNTPQELVVLATPASVSPGGDHTCALASDGLASCWGSNESGQLGDGSTEDSDTPVPVSGGVSFSSLALSGDHTCGLAQDGGTYCWGGNGRGQLGDGSQTDSSTPVAIGGPPFTSLSLAGGYSCGLTDEGDVYCWGYGRNFGQANPDIWVPRRIASEFASIDAGDQLCGVDGDGDAQCWVDDGPTTKATPTPVPGGLTFASLSRGGSTVCGITTGEITYCWGDNRNGETGDGSSTAFHINPVMVSGGLTFASVDVGEGGTCGLTAIGAAYCWGKNDVGQLGDGGQSNSTVPVPVAGGLTFSSMERGVRHVCGKTMDGTTYCWGSNNFAKLGNGLTSFRLTPRAVAGGN
jgi:alpha-tubulin suppressor-like RCC1 family protein